ncbi:copper-resistance protein, CopA family [Chitinophaga sp. CF118]|uniref:multicopper oxidase domain-containing protein n=1 Tax=Chitinophaga sp. CF118 TaxID=1884367 RepID=UPI0008E83386|nr:multicopper oxidase domain-containing protein [Chitinophaga sp. CF118]SFD02109.1 copper-resistance protein, CopA family [Chitinophaga sp. CF118]
MRQFFSIILLLVYGSVFAQHPMKMQETHYNKPSAGVVRYDLYVSDTTVNYSGKSRSAIAINGSIPAPTLYFTEGDTAEIYVHNTMHMSTSIHWHGLILPNRYDGVPYLTTAPIEAGETHLYRFPLVQSGTYWYHSHTMLQEQSGMYGALVIRKKKAGPEKEYTMLLSDWTDDKPYEVDRRLHIATDWYAIRKNSVQSYAEAAKAGHFKTKLTNEWKRMLAMDVSDVYYDRFLTNGKTIDEQPQFKAGDKVRLRIVNGSSSTYFWLNYAGGKITVVANDGMDVEPVEVDRLIVGVAETYDVVVTIPENMRYEFLATSEDRTRSTSLLLGSGMDMPAKHLPRLKYFEGMKMMNDMMKMNGEMNDMDMQMSLQQMDMNTVMYSELSGNEKHDHDMKGMQMDSGGDIVTLNYGMLRSPVKTTLPPGPEKVLHFNLTGNMNRYVWSINNKTVSESDKILIKKGENVKIILYNGTMMRHPMHLHGHFFRVLNGNGDYSPLKNTLDIMPMETDTLEFAATESGDWFFHCHILYHMMSGMGRIFSYENSPANPEIPNPEKAIKKIYADDRQIHPMAKVGLESNGSDGELMFANTRYRLQTEWRIGLTPEHGYESESHLGRYFGKMQWLFPYIGWDFRYRRMDAPEKNLFGQVNTKDYRSAFHAGVEYTLPLLVIADASIDTDGKLRFQLSREDVPVTKRLRFNFMANTDKEYMAGFRYIVTKYFSFSTHYDSDMGFGAGVTLNY